ncbi:hypothetical protein N7495_009940 [Penicillium taxi]|uniref:uncharacterized protein n=1 Tax=Penicillium taxi TaxID=168475 RepID=UPI0025456C31|nr:uncharacterized protein N7495_009940 [Penicillium taxi]KAJ5885430.1 hypothetical protein N7495_009940 [Penicillium taxi]
MSQLAGPQKGTYSIMPSQMMTNKPVNANDEDLIDGMIVGKPLSQPTSMSYCLQRIRLGEFCREMTDSEIFSMSDLAPNFEHTKQIDVKVCEFAASLPSFFSLDLDLEELKKVNPDRSTGVIMQRYIINFMLHTHRCRLHLPCLSRAIKDPTYEYSRNACMEAARLVLRTERQLSSEMIPFVQARLKFSGILHCLCVAIIALLLEYCGRSPHQKKEGDDAEIFQAFAVLEGVKDKSPFAGKLLESFKTVLNRHRTSTSENQSMEISDPANLRLTSSSTTFLPSVNSDDLSIDATLPALDDLWRAFDENSGPVTVDWDALFAGLDNSFSSMY